MEEIDTRPKEMVALMEYEINLLKEKCDIRMREYSWSEQMKDKIIDIYYAIYRWFRWD